MKKFRFGVDRNEILEFGRDIGVRVMGLKFIFMEMLFGVFGRLKLL